MIKKKLSLILSLLILSFLLVSCGSSRHDMSEQDGYSNDSVYVFDKPLSPPPPAPDTTSVQPKVLPPTTPLPPPVANETYYYIIQIGAFKSNERAQALADSAKKEISNKIEISYSSRVNLYVVHLMPPYATKTAAQTAREDLWKKNKFKDAWILTVRK
jgi:cell division septation protein DedD